jgi:hypothetical protein
MNMGMMRWQDLYEQRTQKMGVIWEEKKELTLQQLNQMKQNSDKVSGELEAVVAAAKAIGGGQDGTRALERCLQHRQHPQQHEALPAITTSPVASNDKGLRSHSGGEISPFQTS